MIADSGPIEVKVVSSLAKGEYAEDAALEAQLAATTHQHLTSVRETLNALMQAPATQAQAASNLADLSALCQKATMLVENFGVIQVTSRTYKNFAETMRMWQKFARLDAQIERCAELIRSDQEAIQHFDQGRLPENVLLVQWYLNELQKFEKETMALVTTTIAPSLSNSVKLDSPTTNNTLIAQLKRYFRRLDELRASFEDYFWKLPRTMLRDAANPDTRWLVVHVAKAIVRSSELGIAKGKLKGVWESFVSAKFMASLASAQAGNSVQDTLQSVGFWSDDLEIVRDGLVPSFPSDFDILDMMALLYHRNLHDILQHLGTRTRLTPGDILVLLSWLRDYYSTMNAKFGLSEELLEPRLLRDREAILTKIYLDQSKEKLVTWTNNLLASEVKNFTTREQPPDLDAEDQYLTPAAVDLYQIVKQNIDTAMVSKTPFLVSAVLDSAVQSIKDFQKGLNKALQSECAKFCDPVSGHKQLAPHFEEYVMMLGNSGLCWVRFMEDLAAKLENEAQTRLTIATSAETDINRSIKGLRESNDGFVQLAKDSVDVLVRVIMVSVTPAYAQLFTSTSQDFSSGAVIESICATFEDFLQDYNRHYNPFLMKRLAAQLLEAHILAYVEAMRLKNAKIRIRSEGEGNGGYMARDALQVAQYFVQSGWRDEKRAEKAFEPLNHLIAVLEAQPKLIFMEAVSLFQTCPDFPAAVLEELLAKRVDLDKSTLRDLSESLHSKAKEKKSSAPEVITIFSRLKKSSSSK